MSVPLGIPMLVPRLTARVTLAVRAAASYAVPISPKTLSPNPPLSVLTPEVNLVALVLPTRLCLPAWQCWCVHTWTLCMCSPLGPWGT